MKISKSTVCRSTVWIPVCQIESDRVNFNPELQNPSTLTLFPAFLPKFSIFAHSFVSVLLAAICASLLF